MKIRTKKRPKGKVVDRRPTRKPRKRKDIPLPKNGKRRKGRKASSDRTSASPNASRSSSRDGKSSTFRGTSVERPAGLNGEDSASSDSDGSLESSQPSFIVIEDQDRPWVKKNTKHEPIVQTCCGFCSLGAGSLLTGLMYIGFCIGFLVFRVNDYKLNLNKDEKIWTGQNLYEDIWRVVLIGGMASASLSMLGALILLLASCLFGQKEHYSKMRSAVIIWACVTAFTILCNIGEGLYVILMPKYRDFFLANGRTPIHQSYEEIKANLPTIWALAGVHMIFYVYLVIVLVSYLRLLKYKGAPKVGTDTTESSTKTPASSFPKLNEFGTTPSQGSSRRSSQSISRRSQGSMSDNGSRTPRSMGSRSGSQSSISASNFRMNGNTYINWPAYDDDSALGHSPSDDVRRASDDEQSLPASSVYDMPPADVYDETPNTYDMEPPKVPAPVPKNNARNKDDLNERANAVLELSNSVISDMQSSKKSQPSENTGSLHSPTLKEAPARLTRSASFSSRNSRSSSHRRPITTKKEPDEPEKPKVEPKAVSSFFNNLGGELSKDNPLEEMFRLFGGDLCGKHPENCERYLKSYKDIRSKTSHISSLRDQYEFERFGGNAASKTRPGPQEFRMDRNPYSTNASFYDDVSQPPNLPSRHTSLSTVRPEPVYGYRSQPRESPKKGYPKYTREIPSPSNRPRSRGSTSTMAGYPALPPRGVSKYSSFNPEQSIYYDDSICSTCYGDYYGDYGDYGDYGSYYSYYDYCPPPSNKPAPVHGPLPSVPSKPSSYNPSMSQFSAMSDLRRPCVKNSNSPTWYPVSAEDNYSAYKSGDSYFCSNKSRSLPNLAEPLRGRSHSKNSTDTGVGKPMRPEFTLPSPRQVNRLSRSTSWTSSFVERGHVNRNKPPGARPSSRSKSISGETDKNYSGYHTGDLRRRTSHNTHLTDDTWHERPSTRNSNISTSSSRTVRPRLPPRDTVSSNYEDLGGSFSSFFDGPSTQSRPNSRPSTSRTLSGNQSNDYRRQSNSVRRPSRELSAKADPYPDKHIGYKTPPSSILRSRESSVDGSKSLIPYNGVRNRPGNTKSKESFQRSRSVRYSDQKDTKSSNKQVKFGSTPDLRRI